MTKNAQPESQPRFFALDLLRCVAVVLVLGHHLDPLPDQPPFIARLVQAWQLGGWTGVDLFFVLSGFLVAGLLFREQAQRGRIDFPNFFIRRGLKIYPPFYLMFAVTTLIVWHAGVIPITRSQILSEALFVQNYGTPFWGHTWSLAVEEHFYLLLPLMLIALQKNAPGERDPFRRLPRITLWVAVAALVARWMTDLLLPFSERAHTATHLRIDSLLFGVFIAYRYHLDPQGVSDFCRRNRLVLLVTGVAALSPAFVFDVKALRHLYAPSLTLFYLASGSLLCGLLGMRWGRNWFTATIGLVGANSYSIYLWHNAVRWWGGIVFKKVFGVSLSLWPAILLYMSGSIVFGIVLAKIVEVPVLRLRDRLFPSKSRPMLLPTTRDTLKPAAASSTIAEV